ncbi:GNAT family N-acetyltransferase [Synechococcus sp. ATX 2A4]|uniref:GNAT family N-acetyltransferase n=1 Tax=Synechococcus sp. ATX 2A4 TaxID=2823727 RepID=UPI0020CF443D|nr:GNAT family N-acetyltransferase [Synechococcus sp. ATX 2A4]MCP9886106.1 GNAT family N-acetyltransferase [Synechococcus sp. ATX 2A4]
MLIRRLTDEDHGAAADVYRDAVHSQAPALYSPQQVAAWAGLPLSRPEFRFTLAQGFGLVSEGEPSGSTARPPIEAFAVLEPLDRVALLYCRGRSCRQGRASALLQGLEALALTAGVEALRTEASFISRPLFERQGWQVMAIEELALAGVSFRRFLMQKPLTAPPPG